MLGEIWVSGCSKSSTYGFEANHHTTVPLCIILYITCSCLRANCSFFFFNLIDWQFFFLISFFISWLLAHYIMAFISRHAGHVLKGIAFYIGFVLVRIAPVCTNCLCLCQRSTFDLGWWWWYMQVLPIRLCSNAFSISIRYVQSICTCAKEASYILAGDVCCMYCNFSFLLLHIIPVCARYLCLCQRSIWHLGWWGW